MFKEIAKSQLEERKDIDDYRFDGDNSCLLHHSAIYKSYSTCKFLLERGSNVNVETSDHLMLIHLAVSFDCPKILKLLIEYGATIEGQGKN